MIAGFVAMIAAIFLLAVASRRLAEHLGLAIPRRRQARILAAILLGLSLLLGVAVGKPALALVEWVMAFGVMVPLVALAFTPR